MRMGTAGALAILLSCFLLVAILLAACGTSEPLLFDGEVAHAHVLAQCDLGFRPTGSEAGWATGDYIIAQLEERGWAVETEELTYRGTPVRNIVGRSPTTSDQGVGDEPVIVLGAHYDTRRSADEEDPSVPVMGANDGASGVAVLLELARTLDRELLQHQVWLAFFDAEDGVGEQRPGQAVQRLLALGIVLALHRELLTVDIGGYPCR